MGKKVVDKTPVEMNEEGMTAAQTLAPGSMPAEGAPKTAKMAAVVDLMSKMDGETINKFMEVLAQFDGVFKGEGVPDGAAAQNAATIQAKGAVKEDIETLFVGNELSEEFKEKAATIVEAAVNLKVTEIETSLIEEFEAKTAALEEEYQDKLNEEVKAINDFVIENMDKYLDYVVGEWMQENQVAITSALKNDMNEKFMDKLKEIFVEHYVVIPESKVDVLEQATARIEELEKQLSEQIDKTIELETVLEQTEAEKIFAEVSEGLAASQIEKFKTLSEGIEYNSFDELKSKLNTIKESFLVTEQTKVSAPVKMLFEEIDDELEEPIVKKPLQGMMANYVDVISKTAKS